MLRAKALALFLLVAAAPARAAAPACDGYPRAPIGMAPGFCAGLVVQPAAGVSVSRRQLKLPRTLLWAPGGDLLVTDLGGWDAERGSVWRLTPQVGAPPKLTRLLHRLDLPHTIAIGPDGAVYVGEMSRISRFDPDARDPQATLTPVVEGLPGNQLHDNRHPLSSFVFDADGALLVNVGAPSDQCPPAPGETRCAEAERRAAIWRFAYLGDGRWSPEPEVFATGLRNSLALLRTRAGALVQAENSIDVADPAWPPEELNVLTRGANFGWPYCVGAGEVAPAWRGRGLDCRPFRAPARLLPPHSAPLALLQYEGAMFPELQGKLLVSLHGYRSTGSKIVAYPLDRRGAPSAGKAQVLTPGWRALKGVRRSGSPVGMAIGPDGAIWVADDRNGTILRLARDIGR